MGLGVPVGSPELTLGPLQTSQLLAAVGSPEHRPSEDSQPGIVALKKKNGGWGDCKQEDIYTSEDIQSKTKKR